MDERAAKHLSRDDLLRAGKADIRVRHVGIIQFREFTVKRIPSPVGAFPVLFLDKFLDAAECARVAEEIQLPVQTKNGLFFPKGKASRDFAGL